MNEANTDAEKCKTKYDELTALFDAPLNTMCMENKFSGAEEFVSTMSTKMKTRNDLKPYGYTMVVVDSKKKDKLLINTMSPTPTKDITGFGQMYAQDFDFTGYTSYGAANYMMLFQKEA